MKQFYADLGGQSRPFRYKLSDRIEIENRFGCGLMELIRDKVFPTDPHGKFLGGGMLSVQIALLWVGLRHANPRRVTEAAITEWLSAIIEADGSVFAPINEAMRAVFASGVLGKAVDISDDEPDESKVQAETDPPQGS